jgi:hypothetical protein
LIKIKMMVTRIIKTVVLVFFIAITYSYFRITIGINPTIIIIIII